MISHLMNKLVGLVAAVALSSCGGGSSEPSTPLAPAPSPVPSPAPATVPPAQTDALYNCYDTSDGSRCFATSYQLTTSLTATRLSQQFQDNNGGRNPALLSCKRSAVCSIADLNGGITSQQSSAMRNAATAVVKLTLPFQSFISSTGNGVTFPGLCSGTVIQNSIDNNVYVLTAGHCLYHDGDLFWPSVSSGTYRSNGIPIYVTFAFEEDTCGGVLDFSRIGTKTVTATPVFSSYAPYSATNGWNGSTYGSGPDIALLLLTEPLPVGVVPVRVSLKAMTPQTSAFIFSHPLGVDKKGGVIDGGLVSATGYQYLMRASKRMVEPGSSGGPIFSYDSATNTVELRGVLSGSTKSDDQNPNCNAAEDLAITRIDTQSIFLPRYIGPLQ